VKLLIGDRWSPMVAFAVASVVAALAEAVILTITASVATNLVDGRHRVRISLGLVTIHTTLASILIVALCIAVARLLLQFVLSYYPAQISGEIQASMRTRLFDAYTAAGWDQQSLDREGHFQDVMTLQIMQASLGAIQAMTLVIALFTFLVLVVSAFVLNWLAAVTVLGASVLLFGALRPLGTIGADAARQLSAAQLAYAGSVSEATSIAEEAKVFGVLDAARERVSEVVSATRILFVRTQFLARLAAGLYQCAIYLILVGGLIAINASGTGGFSTLSAVILLMVRAGTYGQQLQTAYQAVVQALPFIERLQATTDRYLASRPAMGIKPLKPIESIAFVDVGYSYRPSQPVLSGLSWEVSAGETIGVVGPSGAGKSTMVQILLRLRFPQAGQYLINGEPAERYSPDDWSRRVVYVPQQPRLVHASVTDNVRFFRNLDDVAVERACRLARIHDEIMSWPNGYDTIVGPRADAVSGGQQQRICLARAIAVGADVLVLDEPTSALDPRSETLIQESLISLKHNLTLFIVAHRMSTLTICDRVMVLLDGRLDAFDTLDELRGSNHYYRMASSLSVPSTLPVNARDVRQNERPKAQGRARRAERPRTP
jgi:ABC-type multidrug transport system fused ATPase/permease subunit